MPERTRTVSIGFALVDEKIKGRSVRLPRGLAEAEQLVDYFSDRVSVAGGSIANVMSNFAGFATFGEAKLFCCVGADGRAQIFRDQTSRKLGQPQLDPDQYTGFCVFVSGENEPEPQEEVTFYGAAESVFVPKNEFWERNDLFVVNLNVCRRPRIFDQVQDVLRKLNQDGGVFALRLNGAAHGGMERPELVSLLASLRMSPEIVFANREELAHLAGDFSLENAIEQIFPDSRLLVVTLGEQGSTVRFEGAVHPIPAFNVQGGVLDTTGAGDAYMGVMLAALFSEPYSKWTERHVRNCAETGSYAASLVIQILNSRLSQPDIEVARRFHWQITNQ